MLRHHTLPTRHQLVGPASARGAAPKSHARKRSNCRRIAVIGERGARRRVARRYVLTSHPPAAPAPSQGNAESALMKSQTYAHNQSPEWSTSAMIPTATRSPRGLRLIEWIQMARSRAVTSTIGMPFTHIA